LVVLSLDGDIQTTAAARDAAVVAVTITTGAIATATSGNTGSGAAFAIDAADAVVVKISKTIEHKRRWRGT
jgi:threonine synthase